MNHRTARSASTVPPSAVRSGAAPWRVPAAAVAAPCLSSLADVHPNRWTAAALALMLGVGTLAGCGSDGDSTPAAGSDPATGSVDDAPTAQALAAPVSPVSPESDAVTALEGTWDYCAGDGLRNTYVFEGNGFEQYVAYFSDEGCTGEPLQEDGLQSPFSPLVTGTFELGDTVTTDTGVEAFEMDFAVGNVQGADAVNALRTYSVVSLSSPTELVFPFLRGATPEERPTDLEFDAVYIKRP